MKFTTVLKTIALSLTVGALILPMSHAALITHSSLGVLLDDHFEGDTVGTSPSGWTTEVGEVLVRDASTNPPGSAASGTKFAEFDANSDELSYTYSSISSGTLTMEFSMYIANQNSAPSSGDRITFDIKKTSSANFIWQLAWDLTNDTITLGGDNTASGINFTRNVWQTYTININPNSADPNPVSFSLDGGSLVFDNLDDTGNPTDRISLRAVPGANVNFYLDGAVIPEPSSLVLMALALLGGAALVRRR